MDAALLAIGRLALRMLCCNTMPQPIHCNVIPQPAYEGPRANSEVYEPSRAAATPSSAAAEEAEAAVIAMPPLSVDHGHAFQRGEDEVHQRSTSGSPVRMSLNRARSSIDRTGNERVHGISDKRLSIYAAFTPAVVHWHLLKHWARADEPAAWSATAAILFVDISGFTSLCTRLEVDVLQEHMYTYFTRLTNVVTQRAGDVVRVVGDAIICAWFVQDRASLALAARAACRCAVALLQSCGTYAIPELGAYELTIHAGIGVGRTHCFLVGSTERKEFLLCGDPLTQAYAAEHAARRGEVLCSPEAWELVSQGCDGEVRPDGHVVLRYAQAAARLMPSATSLDEIDTSPDEVDASRDQIDTSPDEVGTSRDEVDASPDEVVGASVAVGVDGLVPADDGASPCGRWQANVRALDGGSALPPTLESVLLAPGLLNLQRSGETHLHDAMQGSAIAREHVERALRSFTHRDVRREIDGCIDLSELAIAEQRAVSVAFCEVVGLVGALESGAGGLPAVQRCLQAALEAIVGCGGLLRQFIRDDKGVVLIWTFGLHGSASEAPGARAIASCFDVRAALEAHGLTTRIGVTSGPAFCGLVGAPYRAEYSVLGPCVNLAARLMGQCAVLGVDLLCDAATRGQMERPPPSPLPSPLPSHITKCLHPTQGGLPFRRNTCRPKRLPR